MPTLQKIIDLQKVGRFEKQTAPGSLRFSQVALIFGENGWGKSTLADILRSLTRNHPDIIIGRQTLATGGRQKVLLLIDGQQCAFDGAAWTGTRPRIAVFDQAFINENVFSGDSVSLDHMKRQYGLVVGAEGVALIEQAIEIDRQLKEAGQALKEKDQYLAATAAALNLRITAAAFADFAALDGADDAIAAKEVEVRRAIEKEQIRTAALPQGLPVPTAATELTAVLGQTISHVATDLHRRLQDHIARHASGRPASTAHEAWLESGLAFGTARDCPFCGQELRDRGLLDLYRPISAMPTRALPPQ